MSVGSVFGLGAHSGPSLREIVDQAVIEWALHVEGPPKGPATFRLVQAPDVRVQMRPSTRLRSAQIRSDEPSR